tara:strand:- start:484 stop:3717 length:3234 start_codon:yes stop_codon:yes gene_type:complete
MGVIDVQIPSGEVVQVEIAGETPTEEEQKIIIKKFTPDTSPKSKTPEIDISKASKEELQNYIRERRAAGIDPYTGEPLSEDELIRTYKEPGVDYATGVDSIGGFSRFQFGRMDTKEEKENYLDSVVGKDGFRSDALGRLLLTQKGRTKLGLGKGKDIAIDEEGLSFSDVKDFAGSSGIPVAAAIGTGIVTSGLGFIPAILAVAAAGYGGKRIDEAIETAEGFQRQTPEEIERDARFEAAFAAGGEGIGRAISGLFGKLLKGPGGKEADELRANARELLKKGFRPTIAGATNESFRPILNRLQAVYEGVFPNKVAAENNLRLILKDMKDLNLADTKTLQGLKSVVSKDLSKYYRNNATKLSDATKEINTEIDTELNKIFSNFDTGKVDLFETNKLVNAQRANFSELMDDLYKSVDDTLSKGTALEEGPAQRFVSVKGIAETVDDILRRTIVNINPNNRLIQSIRQYQSRQPTPGFMSFREAQILRKQINEATSNPELLDKLALEELVLIKKSVNSAFEDAAYRLKISADPRASEAFSVYTRTNNLYGKGMKMFDNVATRGIIKAAQNGFFNKQYVVKELIDKNRPELIDQVLKAVRGITKEDLDPDMQGLIKVIDQKDAEAILKQYESLRTFGNMNLKQAKENYAKLDKSSAVARDMKQAIERIEEVAARRASVFGSNGKQVAEQVRGAIAKEYLEQMRDESIIIDKLTGNQVVDGVKMASLIRSRGEAIDRLFAGNKKDLDDFVDVLSLTKANVSPDVLDEMLDRPLGQALNSYKEALKVAAQEESNVLVNTLRATDDPEVIANAVFKTPGTIDEANKILAPETMELTKDAAMGKILKQIGATVDDQGVVKLTDDFVDAFNSGRLGSKLQGVLRTYGDETIDSMFGKGAADGLTGLAENMVKVSNTSIAGKGGLAAPQIALGFTLGNLLFSGNFLALLGTGIGFKFMSAALRRPEVLKMMMAPTQPNKLRQFLAGKLAADDPIAQGFQIFQTLLSNAQLQGGRGLVEETKQEAQPYIEETVKQVTPKVKEMTSDIVSQLPNVQPPAPGTSASMINPITIPDPTTLALAQTLQNRRRA